MSQALAFADPELDVAKPAAPPHLVVVPETVADASAGVAMAEASPAEDATEDWNVTFETFWSYVRPWVIGFVVVTALLTGLPMWAYTGVLGDGLALGVFSGIWIGGGYGFIAGATQWYHHVHEA